MPSRPESLAVVTLAILAGASLLVACASPNAATTALTAADVSGPAATESPAPAAPATAAAPAAAESDAPAPGRLVCTTKDGLGVKTQLFLEGDGATASGVLRSVGPSGNVTTRRIRAERLDGLIVADDPNETDLVVHAATVRQHAGKAYMRLGAHDQPWSKCE